MPCTPCGTSQPSVALKTITAHKLIRHVIQNVAKYHGDPHCQDPVKLTFVKMK